MNKTKKNFYLALVFTLLPFIIPIINFFLYKLNDIQIDKAPNLFLDWISYYMPPEELIDRSEIFNDFVGDIFVINYIILILFVIASYIFSIKTIRSRRILNNSKLYTYTSIIFIILNSITLLPILPYTLLALIFILG